MARCLEGSTSAAFAPESLDIKEVLREYHPGDGSIDLLVTGKTERGPFVLAIENKVDAPEEVGQVAKYAAALRRKFPKEVVAIVLLSPEGRMPNRTPEGVPWAAVSYEHVHTALEGALAEVSRGQTNTSTGLEIAQQYLSLVGRNIMAGSDIIDDICREILRGEHAEAWREIRARMPSEIDELHRALGAACCEAFERECGEEWISVVRRGMYATVCRPAWLQLGEASGDDRKFVTFEESDPPRPASIHFRFRLYPLDDEGPRFKLEARIKVPPPGVIGRRVHEAVSRALAEAGHKLPSKDQFTVTLANKIKVEDDHHWDVAANHAFKDAHVAALTRAIENALDRKP